MRGRKSLLPAALILLLLAAGTGAVEGAVYEFDVPLAPVCLAGSYPVTVSADAGIFSGHLTVTTLPTGKVTGDLTLGTGAFAVTGKIKFRATRARLSLKAVSTAGGKERITFKGDLTGNTFSGTTKGKGTVAAGAGTFDLDIAAAGPAVAGFHVDLVTDERGKLSGSGNVTVCAPPVDLAASGKNGKKFKLKLAAKGFAFSATGLPFSSGVSVVYKIKGYGAKTSDGGFTLPVIAPPLDLTYTETKPLYEAGEEIFPNVPDSRGGDIVSYSVSPPLPAGITLQPANGVIRGTPTTVTEAADYVVTATNVAGSATVTLRIGVRINRAESLAPQAGPLSDDDIRHFLTRTEFGVTNASFRKLSRTKLSNYVGDMLVFRKNTSWEKAAEAQLRNEEDPEGLEGQFPSTSDLARWWLEIMMNTENPFQEVMALFWHDHFATSSDVLSSDRRRWMRDQIDLWRHEGNGNLRDLLVAMARDPAMLKWLDGVSNQRKAPNENFAREFWELFTLGVDNGYTQADILEAARAFTGYRERYDDTTKLRTIEFDPNRHDAESKTFFGRTVPGQNAGDDYEAVVDITLEERPVAEFLSRKLFSRFCYADPPDALIAEMAATLRDARWELKPLLEKLLTSEAFFSRRSREGIVKSPVEFSLGFIRSTGLAIRVSSLDSSLIEMAQRPTQPPTVEGWPEGSEWLSAQQMVERANLALTCITDRSRQADAGIDVADILPPEDQRSAEQVVDALTALLGVRPSPADRAAFVDYLNTNRKSDGTTEVSPFDGSDPRHIDERVRGLLYILAQHPTCHIR